MKALIIILLLVLAAMTIVILYSALIVASDYDDAIDELEMDEDTDERD